ncbi:hypothetical protein SADUNF_Sadunf18G0021100 [Salix dunnii]|uniref:C2 NT-type domain-containing protein n=1 Tax=Salix dunnii TaxID=1413687 RepID=A0A835J5I6_9ROSI|nr:hypothetical protein SADUNF_Sadunf18G0021100 [Salix dunnii]
MMSFRGGNQNKKIAMKWSWNQAAGATKKIHVKVRPLKLEGLLSKEKVGDNGRERMVFVVEMKWKGPKSSGLVPFYRVSKRQRNYSSQKSLKEGESEIEWNGEEFESVWIPSKDNSFVQWDVSFSVLYGEDEKPRAKMEVVGNVTLNIAELASKMNSQIEQKMPISLHFDGVDCQATLLIGVSFAEVRNSCDQAGTAQNSDDSGAKKGLCKIITASTNEMDRVNQGSCRDESTMFDSDDLAGTLTYTNDGSSQEMSSGTDLGSSPETRSDRVTKVKLFSWKKRRLSFSLSRRKVEPFIEKTNAKVDISDFTQKDKWEVKELVSRDGQAKLKAKVFLASFDQRGEKAAGESACTAIVAFIADWLHSNQELMPTLSQFDNLIAQGSHEWRKLCDNEAYMNSFPDNHFDLETVLKADLRPLTISHEKSFTGIFSPQKFENLKGATSFDDIWQEITSNIKDYEQRIYIVSWNDHFFVLKVEAEAYCIIDSLGERLFEGCSQAYILKFDDSSLMYGKVAKDVATTEMAGEERAKDNDDIVCKGKECCKEFIKRFLAAIPVGELEEEEKKGAVSTFSLLKRLQIDFHYCSSLHASYSSPTSSTFF